MSDMQANLDGIRSLRRFREEFKSQKLGLWDLLKYKSDIELAAAFCSLFNPEFVEVEGNVFLAELFDEESYRLSKENYEGDRRKIEMLLNHVHIYDLFEGEESDATLYEYVGRTLTQCWTKALQLRFPGRTFDVVFSNEPEGYGPTLTFATV